MRQIFLKILVFKLLSLELIHDFNEPEQIKFQEKRIFFKIFKILFKNMVILFILD